MTTLCDQALNFFSLSSSDNPGLLGGRLFLLFPFTDFLVNVRLTFLMSTGRLIHDNNNAHWWYYCTAVCVGSHRSLCK